MVRMSLTSSEFHTNCIDVFWQEGIDKIIRFLNEDYTWNFEIVYWEPWQIKFTHEWKEAYLHSFSDFRKILLNNHNANLNALFGYNLAHKKTQLTKEYMQWLSLPESIEELKKVLFQIASRNEFDIISSKVRDICASETKEILRRERVFHLWESLINKYDEKLIVAAESYFAHNVDLEKIENNTGFWSTNEFLYEFIKRARRKLDLNKLLSLGFLPKNFGPVHDRNTYGVAINWLYIPYERL